MAITALPTPPTRDDPTNFAARGDAFLAALPTFATEANAQADVVNEQTALATASAAVAGAASKTALGAANYKGEWSTLTGALAVPASVSHNDISWLLINDVADVTLSQPGVSADWLVLYSQAFEIGDIKQSSATQDATWLPCDGSEYTTATYPTLAAALPNTAYDLENSAAGMYSSSAGSVAYNGTNTYVMADGSGVLSSSADGVTWVERYIPFTASLGALTYTGGYFCLAVTSGFYYSADGITWAFQYLSSSQNIREVRYGASVWVALGDATSSNIFYASSINGTYTNSGGTSGGGAQNRLFFFGTRFFTLGNADVTTNIWSSTNGSTWTAASSVAPGIVMIDMDYDGVSSYVAVGAGGNIWYSGSGTSWTQASSTGSSQFVKVKFANALWVAISAASAVYTSPSATPPVTWTSRTTGLSEHYGLAFGNGKWVVTSNSYSRIAHSTDGASWTIVSAYNFGDAATDYRSVPLIYAGGKFVFSHGSYSVVSTAADGAGAWTTGKNQKWIGSANNTSNENWYADNGSGTLMLPAFTGVLVTTNQTTYTYKQVASGAITGINTVAYAGGAWFACSTTSYALYRSTNDGTSWTAVSPAVSNTHLSVNYNGSSQYLATMSYDGASGKVRTSPDGITWTERTVGGTAAFYKSIWFGGAWIIYNSTTVYRSPDGITWTPVITTTGITTAKVVNGALFVLADSICFKSTNGLGFSRLVFRATAQTKYDVEYFNGKYVITSRTYDASTYILRNAIWESSDGVYFSPAMMPQDYADSVLLLKVIGSTLYALGTNWIYSSKDGVNWARFAIPGVNLNSRGVALINFAGKVVLYQGSSALPASTTKFRVPEPTLQLGAPSFIKANYA